MKKDLKSGVFYATLFLAAALCLFVPGQTETRGMIMAGGMLAFALINWIFETVPIAVTSLSIIALVPFTGLMDFTLAIEKSFGNSVFGFFLGVLLLSFAFKETNLGRIITQMLFRLFGKKSRNIVLGIMIAGAALAMWITEVAAAAVVFPIAMSVWEKTKGRPEHAEFGRALMLGVAWGCAFGGVATPIATGANLVAVNYLESQCGIVITFGEWLKIGLPITIVLTLVGWLLLTFRLKNVEIAESQMQEAPYGKREKALTVIFIAAILFWTFGSQIGLSSHHVALLAAMALFLPGVEVVEWKKAVSSISWDSILLIASGMLLGDLLYETGIAQLIADAVFKPQMLSGGLFVRGFIIVLMVSMLKILFSSNTVSGIVLVPIMISVAQNNGLSPWGLVAPCIFSSALSLMVVSSSPVNVIPYSSKAFTQKDMACSGVVMTVCASAIIGFFLMLFGVN